MIIRKAILKDISVIANIYDEICDAQDEGKLAVSWVKGVYPTEDTAMAALKRDDLFIIEEDGKIVGTGIINQKQMDSYDGADWKFPAKDQEVMVLHTLAISPKVGRKGYGSAFVRYYEEYARENGCYYLRMDTNAINKTARALYKKLGYKEIGMVPCDFNGIKGFHMVLLEKYIGS